MQTNPLENNTVPKDTSSQSQFRILFSNQNATSNVTEECLWTWTEAIFKPSQVQPVIEISRLSLYETQTHQTQGRARVRFNDTTSTLIEEASEIALELPSIPPINDFCYSLSLAGTHTEQQQPIGFVSNEADSSWMYTMDAVKRLPKGYLQKSLQDVLSEISRRDRLRLAAGLACGAVQFCGNWLKPSWDSSDVHLAADEDGYHVLMDSLYLSWPLLASTRREPCHSVRYPDVRNNILLPLGLALVELSFGLDLSTFFTPEDEHPDPLVTKHRVASRLVGNVDLESGIPYGDAVRSCLHWSGVSLLCNESKFEDRVFEGIVSPLLKNLVSFEGLDDLKSS